MPKPTQLSPAIFLAVLLLAAALFLPRLPGANAASLEFFRAILGGSTSPEAVPAEHPRAAAWRAVRLFEAGQDAQLVAALPPLEAISDPVILQLAAQAYLRLGEYGRAVDFLEKTGSVTQLLEAADQAIEAGAVDAAESAYRTAFELDPIETTAPLADFLLRVRLDPDAAIDLLREAVARTGSNRLPPSCPTAGTSTIKPPILPPTTRPRLTSSSFNNWKNKNAGWKRPMHTLLLSKRTA